VLIRPFMLGKHIDLIAIGFLLLAIAVYGHARRLVVIQPYGPTRVILIKRQPRIPVFVAPKLPTLALHRG
jgi:hypothetical protein